MITLKLRVDAYLLLQNSRRLSEETRSVLKSASRSAGGGRWAMTCSNRVAKELWAWFDACEAISAASSAQAWKVSICVDAKVAIQHAFARHRMPLNGAQSFGISTDGGCP